MNIMDRFASAAGRAAGEAGPPVWALEIWDRLRPYLRGLALEYGRTGCDVDPHDPADGPSTTYVTPAEGASEVIEVEALLGKAATRGHVANNGPGEVIVSWVPWAGETFQGEYHLAPGAVLDTSSWIVKRVRIEAPTGEGDAEVQTLWQ